MRPIIYALTILIVPGGFLFCCVNMYNRRQKRLRIEARLNSISRASLDGRYHPLYGRLAEDERSMRAREDRPDWARAEPYGKGSASSYCPDWAVPEDEK